MFIKSSQLDNLVKKAKESLRKRSHLLLHKHSDPVLKLVMAMEPETYAQPNKHTGENCQELYVALRGKLVVIIFDDKGIVKEHGVIGPGEENLMVEIPINTWHTIFSLEEGSIVMEIIKGPYIDATFKEFPEWAPSENDSSHSEYKKKILELLKLSL